MLADSGFATLGFRILGRNLREVDGKRWMDSNHNLDRLVERDGVRYGVEIKNQLGYISRDELEIKVAMAEHFGVRPMFIARMMPKTYINEERKAGGFSLILGEQFYPLLAKDLARRVRAGLGLPVTVIKAWPDTALARFENWHVNSLKGE